VREAERNRRRAPGAGACARACAGGRARTMGRKRAKSGVVWCWQVGMMATGAATVSRPSTNVPAAKAALILSAGSVPGCSSSCGAAAQGRGWADAAGRGGDQGQP